MVSGRKVITGKGRRLDQTETQNTFTLSSSSAFFLEGHILTLHLSYKEKTDVRLKRTWKGLSPAPFAANLSRCRRGVTMAPSE